MSYASLAGSLVCHALRHPGDFYSSVGPTVNELSFGLLGSSFQPKRDIGDLAGKVVFITGGKDTLSWPAMHRLQATSLTAPGQSRKCRSWKGNRPPACPPSSVPYLPGRSHREQSPRCNCLDSGGSPGARRHQTHIARPVLLPVCSRGGREIHRGMRSPRLVDPERRHHGYSAGRH